MTSRLAITATFLATCFSLRAATHPHIVFNQKGVGESANVRNGEYLFIPGKAGNALFEHTGADALTKLKLYRGNEELDDDSPIDGRNTLSYNVERGVEYRLVVDTSLLLRSKVVISLPSPSVIELPPPMSVGTEDMILSYERQPKPVIQNTLLQREVP